MRVLCLCDCVIGKSLRSTPRDSTRSLHSLSPGGGGGVGGGAGHVRADSASLIQATMASRYNSMNGRISPSQNSPRVNHVGGDHDDDEDDGGMEFSDPLDGHESSFNRRPATPSSQTRPIGNTLPVARVPSALHIEEDGDAPAIATPEPHPVSQPPAPQRGFAPGQGPPRAGPPGAGAGRGGAPPMGPGAPQAPRMSNARPPGPGPAPGRAAPNLSAAGGASPMPVSPPPEYEEGGQAAPLQRGGGGSQRQLVPGGGGSQRNLNGNGPPQQGGPPAPGRGPAPPGRGKQHPIQRCTRDTVF